ncbi:methyltransferase [Rhodoplanes roseus]|uniref:Methyltransferase n=1 Tax=Rhodoplanes roseus TaxID=29409 RepID=A0A327L6Q0_9BRAD|nr:methyltransferase [Rhodoplanes roseus]RAI45202.1 methyltransferase [Rhodoplanes roseus]
MKNPAPQEHVPSVWRERWLGLRNRLLASPRFQRFAASFPLTRPIARRRTRALFDLCAGFVYSQILLACVRLRLFDRLAAGPLTVGAIAGGTGLSEDAARRLLAAAATLGLVEACGTDRWGLGVHGAALLGNGGLADMIEHHALLYADLADPVALLKGELRDTALSRYWAYAASPEPGALGAEHVASYSRLMAATQAFIADEVLAAAPLGGRRRLLDVGGGEGAFLGAVGARHPGLDLMLFDLPAVTERARERFAAAGLSGRVAVHGGDFRRDPLPAGADTISFVRVLHDHDDETVLALLRAARRALPAGGQVMIAEPMAGAPGAEPAGEAYFGFYLLAMGRGRPRTPEALYSLLDAAGFVRPRLVRTRNPLLMQLVIADAQGA